MVDKKIIGLVENITIVGEGKKQTVLGRIDTGAAKSSIDTNLADDLNLGPITRTKVIRSSQGRTLRPLLRATIILAGKEITGEFSVADRSHMKYPLLIGRNMLEKNGFLIDPDIKTK